MFARALFAFLALPGIVAFLIPIWFIRGDGNRLVQPVGLIVMALGTGLLLWCVRDFYVAGKGTLAPWSPPKNLVVVGLYRWSRNPMYVAVVTILLGWALAFGSRDIGWYALFMAFVFLVRVMVFEEPWLERTHGQPFRDYRARVRRWL
jgi:protein-S-isoprenylcysteine O-methyltransferase Ste14